jgi:hypothetical protein
MSSPPTPIISAAAAGGVEQSNGESAAVADAACVAGVAANVDLLACAFLEVALGQLEYGYVDTGRRLLSEAGCVLGLEVNVTGASLFGQYD